MVAMVKVVRGHVHAQAASATLARHSDGVTGPIMHQRMTQCDQYFRERAGDSMVIEIIQWH